MERLTLHCNRDGTVSQPTNLDWYAVLDKLTQYEDTGLQPEEIAQAYDEGMHSGTWLTCQVVLSMLNDKSKPLTQRVGDIKHFCNTIKPLSQSEPEDKDATTNT